MRILLFLFLISISAGAQTEQVNSNELPRGNDSIQANIQSTESSDSLIWLNTIYSPSSLQTDGKFTLLNFWTSSSSHSMGQLKQMKELSEQHRDLEIIIVHSGKYESERITENIRLAIVQHDIPFPVINDSTFAIWDQYGVSAWPTNILFDPKGEIIMKSEGAEITGDISAMIALYENPTKETGSSGKIETSRFHQGLLTFPAFVESGDDFNLFISDTRNHRILRTSETGQTENIIGSGSEGFVDGESINARFSFPHGMFFHPKDSLLYIADTGNDAIRVYDLKSDKVRTILGNGKRGLDIPETISGNSHALNQPTDLTLADNELYFTMTGWNQIWKMNLESNKAEPVAGTGKFGFTEGRTHKSELAEPYGITSDSEGVIYFTERQSSAIRTLKRNKVDILVGAGVFEFGDVDGNAKNTRMQGLGGITFFDNNLYVADQYNNKIKIVDPYNGRSETFLGSGNQGFINNSGKNAAFSFPGDVTILKNQLYIADTYNQIVRKASMDGERLSTLDFPNKNEIEFIALYNRKIFETDTVYIGKGTTDINIRLELDSNWSYLTDAPHSVYLANRANGVTQLPENFDPYSQSINFRLENQGALQMFMLDCELFYQNVDETGRKYMRNFTLMVHVKTLEGSESEKLLTFQVPSPLIH